MYFSVIPSLRKNYFKKGRSVLVWRDIEREIDVYMILYILKPKFEGMIRERERKELTGSAVSCRNSSSFFCGII